MSDEAAFLDALKANPADDTTRLVYADWLDEHEEAQKAQYLRAVADLTRFAGGTSEYTDAAVRLYTACHRTDASWRAVAGARFDVFIDRYYPANKIQLVMAIRERTGFGLGGAKALAESVPTPLFSWLPFEQALPHLLAFRPRLPAKPKAFKASIRPTVLPEGAAPGVVFDVELCSCDFGTWDVAQTLRSQVTGIAGLLGIPPEQVEARLRELPLVVGSGLQPAAVAEFVRQLKVICNVFQALPPGAIRVVPRPLNP